MKNREKVLKIIKLVVINLLLIAVVFMGFDLYIYIKNYRKQGFTSYFDIYRNKTQQELMLEYIYKKDKRLTNIFKSIENQESSLGPILLFGDSFVYSNRLGENGSFAHILGEYTKRPIYNQSTPYVKVQHMLFALQQEEFYKIVKKPEYIFYIYVPAHIIETYTKNSASSHDVFYKFQNGALKRYEKIPLYKKSYFLAYINARLLKTNESVNKFYFKAGEAMYKALLIESKNEMQKRWGKNFKFVIIRYFKTCNQLEDKMFEELKQEGFIVFEIYKFIDTKSEKYLTTRKIRPNELLWKTAIPIMVKELNIK